MGLRGRAPGYVRNPRDGSWALLRCGACGEPRGTEFVRRPDGSLEPRCWGCVREGEGGRPCEDGGGELMDEFRAQEVMES